jgi:hypothetical protein
MSSPPPTPSMKRRSFFATALAGLAGMTAALPFFRASAEETAGPLSPPATRGRGETRIMIHPLAIPRTEKKHG